MRLHALEKIRRRVGGEKGMHSYAVPPNLPGGPRCIENKDSADLHTGGDPKRQESDFARELKKARERLRGDPN